MNIKKFVSLFSLIIALSLVAPVCIAEIMIVTSKTNPLDKLKPSQCKRLWLGDKDVINGNKMLVIDQFTSSKLRHDFYRLVTKLSQKQLRSYRAKKIFSDGIFPPETRADDSKVIKWILQGDNRIGYIKSTSYIAGLKVLLVIKE